MDEAALRETEQCGEATFYSRWRQARCRKGESSGYRLKVRSVAADCDSDALLLQVEPLGPACHRGTTACFGDEIATGVGFLAALERVIAERQDADPAESATAKLMAEGVKRIAQKVGEEGVETAIAGACGTDEELSAEAADL